MPNRRIVYISDSTKVTFFTKEKYSGYEYSFYEFHDALTDENVIINYDFYSKFSKKIIRRDPIFASVELFYINSIIVEKAHNGCVTSRLKTLYFNPRLLTAKQIEKFKDKNAEFLI